MELVKSLSSFQCSDIHHWLIGFVTYVEYSLCSKFFLLAAFRTEQMMLVNKAGNSAVNDYRFFVFELDFFVS